MTADLVERFLGEVGRRAAAHRDLAGRRKGNLSDAVRALEELGVRCDELTAAQLLKLATVES